MADESWKVYSDALRYLLSSPKMLDKFRQDMGTETNAELSLSGPMSTDLKNLFLLPSMQAPPVSPGSASAEDDTIAKKATEAQEFFETTARYVRRGALATTVMSILVFLMGLILLGIAAAQSMNGSQPGTALVVAASGIVAIATAFYRSPVTQIRESAADAQRSNMVLMSYLLGLSLLSKSLSGRQTGKEAEMLTALTRDLVGLLPGAQPAPSSVSAQESTGSTLGGGRPSAGDGETG